MTSTYQPATWGEAAHARIAEQDFEQRMTERAKAQEANPTQQATSHEGTALAALDGLLAAFRDADTYRDNDLKPEAQNALRDRMRDIAVNGIGAKVNAIAATAAKEADAAGKDLSQYLLKVESTDVTTAGQAWQHSVVPTLESGPPALVDWDRIVARANPDELAAILRYGKAWVRRNIPGNDLPQVKDAIAEQQWAGILNAVQQRHLDLHPDDAARDALARSRRANVAATATGKVARQLASGQMRNAQQVSFASITLKTTGNAW